MLIEIYQSLHKSYDSHVVNFITLIFVYSFFLNFAGGLFTLQRQHSMQREIKFVSWKPPGTFGDRIKNNHKSYDSNSSHPVQILWLKEKSKNLKAKR